MSNKNLDQYMDPNSGYGKQKTLMDQQRAVANRILEVQKKQEQQAAAIQHQKLLKYLPEYQKSMGLKGNGMSETALLDANASYRSEQRRINSEYSARQDAVNEQYRQNLLDLYTRAEAEKKQDRENLYNKAKDAITSWQGSSEELTKYVEGLSGQLDDNDYAILKDVYRGINNGIVAEENAKKLEEAKNAIKVDDLGDKTLSNTVPKEYAKGRNFKVIFNNHNYNVQVGDKVSNADLQTAAKNSGVAEGAVFVYKGNIYLQGTDGIYSITKRGLQPEGANEKDFLMDALKTTSSTSYSVNRYRNLKH